MSHQHWRKAGKQVSNSIIQSEINFFSSVGLVVPKEFQSHLFLCLMPTFSSFIYESAAFLESELQRLDQSRRAGSPQRISPLNNWPDQGTVDGIVQLIEGRRPLLATARQRMKFLDDNALSYEQIRTNYLQQIAEDSVYYSDLHQGRLRRIQRLVQPDLGLSLVGGRVFATTHVHYLNIAIDKLHQAGPPSGSFRERGLVFEIARDYGKYIGSLIDMYSKSGYRLTLIRSDNYPLIRFADIKSQRHHRDVSNRLAPELREIALFLYVVLTQLRVVAWLIPYVQSSVDPLSGLRSSFLLTYQAARSLSILLNTRWPEEQSKTIFAKELAEALIQPEVQSLLGLRSLRNTLMHFYIPRGTASRLDLESKDFGLVEADDSSTNLECVRRDVQKVAESLGDQVELWLQSPIRRIQNFD